MIWSIRVQTVILVLISVGSCAIEVDKQYCREQMNSCSLKTECLNDLRVAGHKYIQECPHLTEYWEKSLYKEENLTFAVDPAIANEFPTPRTHSVYLCDDYYGKKPELVKGCCNLTENENCSMPAVIYKNKPFYVIFPFKEGMENLYCYHKVDYYDSPIYECGVEKEIIDSCWKFEDGELRIFYRYTPLSPGQSERLEMDICYFTMSSKELPDENQQYKSDEYTTVRRLSITAVQNEAGSCNVTFGNPSILRSGKYFENVTQAKLGERNEEIFDPSQGDLLCFGFQISRPVHKSLQESLQSSMQCTFVDMSSSNQIWQIPVVVSSFVALLVLILAVKIRGMRHIPKEKEKKLKARLASTDIMATESSRTSSGSSQAQENVYLVTAVLEGTGGGEDSKTDSILQSTTSLGNERSSVHEESESLLPNSSDKRTVDGDQKFVDAVEITDAETVTGVYLSNPIKEAKIDTDMGSHGGDGLGEQNNSGYLPKPIANQISLDSSSGSETSNASPNSLRNARNSSESDTSSDGFSDGFNFTKNASVPEGTCDGYIPKYLTTSQGVFVSSEA